LIDGDDMPRRRRKTSRFCVFGVMYQSGALFGSMTLRETSRCRWKNLPTAARSDSFDRADEAAPVG
jgi:ABC-type transporter Mla maintaining outer membrane lipid asymmetry ATPase subunit MlaF